MLTPIGSLARIANAEMAEAAAPPMPTEGIRAISAICSQAASSMAALAGSRPAGLGMIVAGNNAGSPPAAQRISGMNGEALSNAIPDTSTLEKIPTKEAAKEDAGSSGETDRVSSERLGELAAAGVGGALERTFGEAT